MSENAKDNAVLQAQTWAQEARTLKSIISEIGKLVDCSNDWEMVTAVKSALQNQKTPAVPDDVRAKVLEFCSAVENADDLPLNKCALRCGRLVNEVKDMLAAAPRPAHTPDAKREVRGKNRYGLNIGYFASLITREFRDLSNYRPDEFARVCARMAKTADAAVLQEEEFQPAHSPDGGEVVPAGWIWDAYGQRNFTTGEHHKEVLEADGVTLIPAYTHPAQPRNDMDRLRSNGGEG